MEVDASIRLAIVGAGHAGSSIAAILRQRGFEGSLLLLGEEPVAPYHRPPLSKGFAAGETEQLLRPERFYREQEIVLRTEAHATSIDLAQRTVTVDGGEVIAYDVLVLATGSVNRKLPVPGAELSGIHQLRTIADARRLKEKVPPGGRLVIVGGGYIGLEVAAAARENDVAVTVIEREDRVLPRVASEALSAFLARHHSRRGTKILTSAEVAAFEPDCHGHVRSLALADGRCVECDAVLIGVGAVANDALARSAGLLCEDGVIVDERTATSDPHVYAIGDVTRRPVPHRDGLFRLESIPSATDQARQAAAAIVGKPAPKREIPWFWSDQFDLKLQIAGLLQGADSVTVRGDPDAGTFALFHTAGNRLLAVEAVNAARDFVGGRQLIGEPEVDLAIVADRSASLRDAAAPAVSA